MSKCKPHWGRPTTSPIFCTSASCTCTCLLLGPRPIASSMQDQKPPSTTPCSQALYLSSAPSSGWQGWMQKSYLSNLRPAFFGDHRGYEISQLGDAGKRWFPWLSENNTQFSCKPELLSLNAANQVASRESFHASTATRSTNKVSTT